MRKVQKQRANGTFDIRESNDVMLKHYLEAGYTIVKDAVETEIEEEVTKQIQENEQLEMEETLFEEKEIKKLEDLTVLELIDICRELKITFTNRKKTHIINQIKKSGKWTY
jgi:hypothetical protein